MGSMSGVVPVVPVVSGAVKYVDLRPTYSGDPKWGRSR